MSQSIACNRLRGLLERCARRLLMTRDRAKSDNFYLTQEFLAYMLGVRRSGVSIAAGKLAQAGFIRYRRGNIRLASTGKAFSSS
jgi:CRP-like cAMP-binding protein